MFDKLNLKSVEVRSAVGRNKFLKMCRIAYTLFKVAILCQCYLYKIKIDRRPK